MRKIFFLFLLFLFCSDVYAYDFNYKIIDDKYVLLLVENGVTYNYEDVISKFDLEDYMIYNIKGEDYYFYKGIQISKEKYDNDVEMVSLTDFCHNLNDSCKIVSSTEETISAIDYAYNQDSNKIYYLLYTSSNYKKIDFDKIKNYYSDNYLSDIDKNLYKYEEFAYFKPIKFLFSYDNQRIIVDTTIIRTTKEEMTKVDKFLNDFLKLFDSKSDYEKILGVYTYINNTTKYGKDNGYINSLDGQLSAYDVLIKHKTVCIGNATTFQLLMEKLGVESYIVDHVSTKSNDEYVTTHTYNIVKLDGEWYIVDIAFNDNLSGLLLGMNDKYSLDDFKYYDIKIADENYLDTHSNVTKDFEFDYSKLLDLTITIDKNEVSAEKVDENNEKNYIMEYILIGIILVVIFFIIWLFTRKR